MKRRLRNSVVTILKAAERDLRGIVRRGSNGRLARAHKGLVTPAGALRRFDGAA